MIFAMKHISQTSAQVLTFVQDYLQTYEDFTILTGSRKTAFGEYNNFDPDLVEDDLYNVPPYSVVITKAFTQTGSTSNETVVSGNSYRVYMAAKGTNGTTNLYEYPTVLDFSGSADTTLAQVGAIRNVTIDNTSVQNYHTVSFGLESVSASSVENAEIYAAVFTRDLKNEKHAGSLGGFKNEVYSVDESEIAPILTVPAGTSVGPGTFTLDTAIDTNGDVVDLYTVNAGYLYVWAKTLAGSSGDFAGGRSAIQEGGDVFVPPFTFTIDGNEYSRSASDPLYQITLDEVTDADDTKTPWVLALNYIHDGTSVEMTTARTVSEGLPNNPPDFETFDITQNLSTYDNTNPTWTGHTGNDLFNKIAVALGSSANVDNGLEVRFLGKTNNPNSIDKILHIKSLNETMIRSFRYGKDNVQEGSETYPKHVYPYTQESVDLQEIDFNSTLYHTSQMMITGTENVSLSSQHSRLDHEMATMPLFTGNNHWSLNRYNDAGNYWSLDTNVNTSNTYNIYAQVWVRANLPNYVPTTDIATEVTNGEWTLYQKSSVNDTPVSSGIRTPVFAAADTVIYEADGTTVINTGPAYVSSSDKRFIVPTDRTSYTEYLFANNDFSRWIVFNKDIFNGVTSTDFIMCSRSHNSPNHPMVVQVYNDPGYTLVGATENFADELMYDNAARDDLGVMSGYVWSVYTR